jgi:hypothetical protein
MEAGWVQLRQSQLAVMGLCHHLMAMVESQAMAVLCRGCSKQGELCAAKGTAVGQEATSFNSAQQHVDHTSTYASGTTRQLNWMQSAISTVHVLVA